MTRFNLGILNDCLSITVCWRASIHVSVMKHYGVEDSWTKELDISVEYGPSSFGGYAQILSFLPEWQVLLWQGRLQAHTAGSEGFVGLQVDGIPSSVDKAYPHVPSFISLKDVIRCQNPEGQGNVQTNAADHENAKEDKQNLQSNSYGLNQGNVQSVTVPVDQQQQGQLNVQSNAADHGNAEADKGNVQSNADQLDQGNLQSIAATITQKTQENRAPKKAKTTHEVQPMQASSSQPFYASPPKPTQPSVVQL
ncbi:uncharacterized protein LOC133708907 [Rosa rugosa]|uniref:uncharacterized protein LOC133708907 n=1 Tax=Rosa rugosa TaxID=74645 RepID=UPI002B4038D5|nr:uncharacterized protein LOC133708907 [Rosa rugosa]